MLPPPTTIATSTPRSATTFTWSAIAPMRSGSAPYSWSPMSDSPDNLRRMRRKAGLPSSTGGLLLPHHVAREAPDHDVLARFGRGLGAQLLDGLAAVLVLVDVLLVEQDNLLHPLLDAALDDLRPDVLGLVGGLLLEDPRLRLLGLLRDLVLGDVLRGRGGDVQRHVAHELLE